MMNKKILNVATSIVLAGFMAFSAPVGAQAASSKLTPGKLAKMSVDPVFNDYVEEGRNPADFDADYLDYKVVCTQKNVYLVRDTNDKIRSSYITAIGECDDMIELTIVTNQGEGDDGMVQEWYVILQENKNGKYVPWHVQQAKAPVSCGEFDAVPDYHGEDDGQTYTPEKVTKKIWELNRD